MVKLFYCFFTLISVSCFSLYCPWGTEYYDWTVHVPHMHQSLPHEKHEHKKSQKKPAVFYGPVYFENEIIDNSLDISGTLDFDNLEVKKSITVKGPVAGKTLKTQQLTVFGPLTLFDADLEAIDLYGPCTLEQVRVKTIVITIGNDFNIFGGAQENRLYFNNVIADSVIIKNSSRKLIVEVTGNSNIKTIAFENKGQLLSDETSSIGTVKNGTIFIMKEVTNQNNTHDDQEATKETE